jgi:CRISPR-associated protein Csb2
MIRLSIRFLEGRFHATPWMHHVNEGVPEWPPSPWRILRAAVSALYTRSVGIPFDTAYDAVLKLTDAPTFHLPDATAGHTRHYLSQNMLERNDTALTLDAFVAMPAKRAVIVEWPTELSAAERQALKDLFRRIPYLGRAESACNIEVLEAESLAESSNCHPSDGSAAQDQEVIRVLCPASAVSREDLERTSADIQKAGWIDPPGSRWVFYRRPASVLKGANRAIASTPKRSQLPTVAQLTLGGPILPLITDCVPFAARVRRALLKLHDADSPNLSGRVDNTPRTDQHRHAHFVPYAGDPSHPTRVSHVLIFAPDGFSEQEQQSVLRLRTLDALKDEERDIHVLCNGFGQPSDFRRIPHLENGRVWRSRTPLVLPRHPKRNGRDTVEAQISQELEFRGLPGPVAVLPLESVDGRYRPVEFTLRRRDFDQWPTTPALSVELRFDEPLNGPILLGRLSHYGLGQFVPTYE